MGMRSYLNIQKKNVMFTTTFFKYCLWNKTKISMTFFLSGVFFHGHWQFTGQQGKEEDHLLFHSITFRHSRTFRHIFQLCMSMTITHFWLHCLHLPDCYLIRFTTLSNYHSIVWRYDVFICLLDDLILGFRYSNLRQETGGLKLDKQNN